MAVNDSTKQRVFGLRMALVAVAGVAVVGVSGSLVYHDTHKAKSPVADIATTASPVSASLASSNSTAQPAQPIASWETASLQYEKATFKYPSSWKLSNTSEAGAATGGTVTPGSDQATVTSPTGLTVRIDTGVAGFSSVTPTVLGKQSINTLGGSYSLDFYTNDSSNKSEAQGACVTANDAPGAQFGYVPSKNISLTTSDGANSSPANDVVCIEYAPTKGNRPGKAVAGFQQDASFNDAKLIIESLTY